MKASKTNALKIGIYVRVGTKEQLEKFAIGKQIDTWNDCENPNFLSEIKADRGVGK